MREAGPLAVQDETHEKPAIDVDRDCRHVFDPYRAVVLVVKAALLEDIARHAVHDAFCNGARIASVLAHEGMNAEVVIEHFYRARRDRAGQIAHDAPMTAVEIADRKRGQVRGNEPRKMPYPALCKIGGARAALADEVEHVERRPELPIRELARSLGWHMVRNQRVHFFTNW